MSLADFWGSTPREVIEFIDGMVERHNRAYRTATVAGYYAGAIARSEGKLPLYEEIFTETTTVKKETTPEDHLTFWENTAALLNAMEAARQEKSKDGHDRIPV